MSSNITIFNQLLFCTNASASYMIDDFCCNVFIDKIYINVIPGIRTPMHGIDLGKMATQRASSAHLYTADWLDISSNLCQ